MADGVDYLVGDTVVAAVTYPGSGTVTAQAKADHVLGEGDLAHWTVTFQATAAGYQPPAVSPFVDVSTGQQFYKEMAWLSFVQGHQRRLGGNGRYEDLRPAAAREPGCHGSVYVPAQR